MFISLLLIVCVFVDCATLKTIRKGDVQSHERIGRNVQSLDIMCTGCRTMCEGRELMCKGFHMLHNCKNDSVMFYDKSKYYIGKRKEIKGGCEMCKRIREKLFFIEG